MENNAMAPEADHEQEVDHQEEATHNQSDDASEGFDAQQFAELILNEDEELLWLQQPSPVVQTWGRFVSLLFAIGCIVIGFWPLLLLFGSTDNASLGELLLAVGFAYMVFGFPATLLGGLLLYSRSRMKRRRAGKYYALTSNRIIAYDDLKSRGEFAMWERVQSVRTFHRKTGLVTLAFQLYPKMHKTAKTLAFDYLADCEIPIDIAKQIGSQKELPMTFYSNRMVNLEAET